MSRGKPDDREVGMTDDDVRDRLPRVGEHFLIKVVVDDLIIIDESTGAKILVPNDVIADFGIALSHLHYEMFIAPKAPAYIRKMGRDAQRRREERIRADERAKIVAAIREQIEPARADDLDAERGRRIGMQDAAEIAEEAGR